MGRGPHKPADLDTIGGRIKLSRTERKFTQEALSARLNMSRPAIGMWETGRSIPSRKMTAAIAEALEVQLSYLEHGEGSPPVGRELSTFDDAMIVLRGRRWSVTEAIALKALIDVTTA